RHWPWCAAPAAGAALTLAAALPRRRADALLPGPPHRAPAVGLLLLGAALPASATTAQPVLAAAVTAVAALTTAVALGLGRTRAPRPPVAAAALFALVAGTAAGATAPSVAAAVLGTLAGLAGLLLVACAAPAAQPSESDHIRRSQP
ncbi:hypothetical protein ACFXHB_19230, partial [Kitasatospora sp. NPDC059327]